MARTIEEIKADMTSAFMNDAAAQEAYGFASGTKFSAQFSTASVESILFYVFAVCAYAIERLTESHLSDVSTLLATLRPHTLTWYQARALAFRYGESVDDESADYATAETADTVKPIAQCAVGEAEAGGLTIKVATTDDDGNLTYLPTEQKTAFAKYMNRIKDAGIKLNIVTQSGDRLRLNLTVYVDGTVYNEDGTLISEPTKPVETAIREYLTQLPFNGELVLEHLTDYLQTVSGVEVPHINSAYTAHRDTSTGQSDYSDLTAINVRVTPASGYFVVSFDSADSWASSITYKFSE